MVGLHAGEAVMGVYNNFRLASIIVFLAAGCSTQPEPRKNLTVVAADSFHGQRVFILKGECPVNSGRDRTPPQNHAGVEIVGAALGAGVDFAVGMVREIIDQYEKDLNGQFFASRAFKPEFFHETIDSLDELGRKQLEADAKKVSEQGPYIEASQTSCVRIVRGYFGSPRESTKNLNNLKSITTTDISDMYLSFFPDFYAEIEVESKWIYIGSEFKMKKVGSLVLPSWNWSKSNGHMIVRPVFLSYADTSAKRAGTGWKNISIAISISEGVIDAANSSEKQIVIPLSIGRREIGKSYIQNVAEQFAGLEVSSQIPDFIKKNMVNEKKEASYNVQMSVIEADTPSVAERAMLLAFKGNSEAISGALKQWIKDLIK
jgi:hypothetical protein